MARVGCTAPVVALNPGFANNAQSRLLAPAVNLWTRVQAADESALRIYTKNYFSVACLIRGKYWVHVNWCDRSVFDRRIRAN